MTNKEMMKKLFHEKLNQEKNRQRILERITSEPQKQVVYGKWLRTATAFMLVLVAACVLYGQRNQIASKDKEVIFHINEISNPIHIENDAEDCKKIEDEMIFDDCYRELLDTASGVQANAEIDCLDLSGFDIPDDLMDSERNYTYHLQSDTNKNNEDLLQYEKSYTDKDSDRSIRIRYTKGNQPFYAEYIEEGKASIMNKQKLYVYRYDNSYIAQLKLNQMNVTVETANITESELIALLHSITKE